MSQKSDQHDLVSWFREPLTSLAIELGRTPTRREVATHIPGSEYRLTKLGGYTTLLQALGMETYDERRAPGASKKKGIGNEVFVKDLEAHLEAYEPRPAAITGPMPLIATISDIHWPFSSPRVVNRFLEYVGDVKPEWTIINGDAWDMYSHGKYPRSHNIFTPREEQASARKSNVEFWEEVKKRAPETKRVQMMGNHDIRPLKRMLEAYPAAEDWIGEAIKREFTFEGVETIFDYRQELIIGDIAVFHGYRSKLGDHRDYTRMNTINGHTHLGGVSFRRILGKTMWEMNSGVAGDPESKGLSYTPQKITHWTPGFGVVNSLGPQFIPVG